MTHRELIQKAMPLLNLTSEQWDAVSTLLENETDSVLKPALETLLINQSRIETMCILYDSIGDLLNNSVCNYITQQTTIS